LLNLHKLHGGDSGSFHSNLLTEEQVEEFWEMWEELNPLLRYTTPTTGDSGDGGITAPTYDTPTDLPSTSTTITIIPLLLAAGVVITTKKGRKS
jgi:hypothetical protein